MRAKFKRLKARTVARDLAQPSSSAVDAKVVKPSKPFQALALAP
jgi:hypothetical protein